MRGQVSVFMVLAIIIVFLAAMLTLIRQSEVPAQSIITGSNEHSQKLRNIVQSCFEEAIQQQMLMFGLQGGYITPRATLDSLDIDGFLVPYYVYGDVQVIPDADMLRDYQLVSSVESGLMDCLNDFTDFSYPVEYAPPKVKAQILPSNVGFSLQLPAKIEVGQDVIIVPPMYRSIVNSRLGQTMAMARRIASDKDAPTGMVDLSLLDEISKKDYNITVFPYDKDSFFYVITDNHDRVYDMPFRYQFAVKVVR